MKIESSILTALESKGLDVHGDIHLITVLEALLANLKPSARFVSG